MMLLNFIYCKLLFIFCWLKITYSMSIQTDTKVKSYFLDNNRGENDVVKLLVSKGYIPNEKYLPETSVVKSFDSDVTYLLSKLTDEELIKLLNDQPKKTEYDLNDIFKMALDIKYVNENKILKSPDKENKNDNDGYDKERDNNKRFHTVPSKDKSTAFFRLENRQVDPYSVKIERDPDYYAIQKLNNILYSRPQELNKDDKSADEDEKKELLFDILIAQLKALCCKGTKSSKLKTNMKYKEINEFLPFNSIQTERADEQKVRTNEHMFLIINDEIKNNGSDELISVDPDSLEKNSSVLLLGPITTPLTDSQLKLVMNRISNELAKAEYIPLLQQLSDGILRGSNIKLIKSLVTGPDTRRYIKPHRCNHQSKLARIYGGPKWLICTGYININTPSLYD